MPVNSSDLLEHWENAVLPTDGSASWAGLLLLAGSSVTTLWALFWLGRVLEHAIIH